MTNTMIMYHVNACRSTNVDKNYHMEKDTCVTTCTMDTYEHRAISTGFEYNLSRSAMNKQRMKIPRKGIQTTDKKREY